MQAEEKRKFVEFSFLGVCVLIKIDDKTSTNSPLFESFETEYDIFHVVDGEISMIRNCGACKRRHF
jgi:hypothetical protein